MLNDNKSICRRCGKLGHFKISEMVFSNGTKHLQQNCIYCSSFNGYKMQEATKEKALKFVFPFGQYKGNTILSVYKQNKDYLKFIAKKDKKISALCDELFYTQGEEWKLL